MGADDAAPHPALTQRLQLTPQFGFDQAAALAPYLEALGISHLRVTLPQGALGSRTAMTWSTTIRSTELGGEEAFGGSGGARSRGYRLILDFVPNLWAFITRIIRGGSCPSGTEPRAASFDIDWYTLLAHPRGACDFRGARKLLRRGAERGEIELRYDAAEAASPPGIFEHRLPIAPNRYGEIVQKVVAEAGAGEDPGGSEWAGALSRSAAPRFQGRRLQGGACSIAGGKT